VTSHCAVIIVLAGFLVCCSPEPTRLPSIGEAYVGPITLNLRQELALKSPVSATVKHGDKLDIVEYRRRFVRVRTLQGAEGWTDMRQLLTPEQMADLQRIADTAAKYPSQGAASVYEPLNMHFEPNRASPGFWQIPETAKVDVIGHKLMPRVQAAPAAAPTPPKPAPVRKKTKERQQGKLPPPPPPPAPKLPDNWLALSVPKEDAEVSEAPKPEPKPRGPVPSDDWSLVRTKDGKVGWVLTRMLSMAIPDEVAQYAEGHRITSYFPLGQVQDGDTVKNNWLWTTIVKGLEPYEFDSFRVFVWSRRHHRYETAYIERNVVGHFPLKVTNIDTAPAFSLVLENDDGSLVRKTYMFDTYRVRMVKKEPYNPNAEAESHKAVANAPPQPAANSPSLYAKLKDRIKRLLH
jgi:uncharacterized protein YgiM (DUF1202 family)